MDESDDDIVDTLDLNNGMEQQGTEDGDGEVVIASRQTGIISFHQSQGATKRWIWSLDLQGAP